MKFSQKILRVDDFEKLSFFESAILEFVFGNFLDYFFCFIPMKISHKLCDRMHTTYTRNIMCLKCGGDCGLWVLNEMIKKYILNI
jgi:hypothetical protein